MNSLRSRSDISAVSYSAWEGTTPGLERKARIIGDHLEAGHQTRQYAGGRNK